MAVEAPQIPDIRKGMIAFCKGKSDAGQRVSNRAGRAPKRPFVLIDHDGDQQQRDIRVPRGRVVIECFGKTAEEARYLAYQLRDAILPPENVTWGVHAI